MKTRMRVPSGGMRLNEKKVMRLVGEAARQAMIFAGADVQEKTRAAMSNRNVPKRRIQRQVGIRDGRPLVALIQQDPKPDKITSWKTPEHPNGLLYSSVKYYYDPRTKSVVVGPERMGKLRALHEFGGSRPVHFLPVSDGPKRSRKFKNPVFGVFVSQSEPGTINLGTKRIKKRPYMKPGLQKAMRKIPQQFRERLHTGGGPKKLA